MINEADCGSVKKVGDNIGNYEARNTKMLVATKDLELGKFGDDAASEFHNNLLFLRPTSYVFLSGGLDRENHLIRSAGKFFQFSLIAPTSVSKGNALDIKSGLEYILTNFPKHVEHLLFIPENNQLKRFSVEYQLNFLQLQHRVRHSALWINEMNVAFDLLFGTM